MSSLPPELHAYAANMYRWFPEAFCMLGANLDDNCQPAGCSVTNTPEGMRLQAVFQPRHPGRLGTVASSSVGAVPSAPLRPPPAALAQTPEEVLSSIDAHASRLSSLANQLAALNTTAPPVPTLAASSHQVSFNTIASPPPPMVAYSHQMPGAAQPEISRRLDVLTDDILSIASKLEAVNRQELQRQHQLQLQQEQEQHALTLPSAPLKAESPLSKSFTDSALPALQATRMKHNVSVDSLAEETEDNSDERDLPRSSSPSVERLTGHPAAPVPPTSTQPVYSEVVAGSCRAWRSSSTPPEVISKDNYQEKSEKEVSTSAKTPHSGRGAWQVRQGDPEGTGQRHAGRTRSLPSKVALWKRQMNLSISIHKEQELKMEPRSPKNVKEIRKVWGRAQSGAQGGPGSAGIAFQSRSADAIKDRIEKKLSEMFGDSVKKKPVRPERTKTR
eukprot:gnl/TRDRNA2_/TRDRNA2_193195_c0_seq1.p1 gnl/TRDRNA2_/TRDRNA2_193195_c0~~gnl/TRDRNA2_/TRDRNA2_193195_c0_seq1.p1  ORF type:complete len:445 (-),score=79.71 gnl/TRDRNA2_/TRDRNA2_193195_c0_seq1:76-1410(-)